MERRIDLYIKIAQEIASQPGGIESLRGAIENTRRLQKDGEPVSERNLKVLEQLLSLTKRASKNPELN